MRRKSGIIGPLIVAAALCPGLASAELHIAVNGAKNTVLGDEKAKLGLTVTDGDGQPLQGLTNEHCRISEVRESFGDLHTGYRFTIKDDGSTEVAGRYRLVIAPPAGADWFLNDGFRSLVTFDCYFPPYGSDWFTASVVKTDGL